MEDVTSIEGAKLSIRHIECWDLRMAHRAQSRGDARYRNAPFSPALGGLFAARERPRELLEAHVQGSVGSVSVFDPSAFLGPRSGAPERLVACRRGGGSPARADREGGLADPTQPSDAMMRGPLPWTRDRRGKRSPARAEQEEGESVRRQATTRTEHFLDVPEATADDGRKKIDVEPRTACREGPPTRFGRA